MSAVTPYSPATNFAEDEADSISGRSTVRTTNLDAEHSAIALTTSQLAGNQALNQRDDGEIRDERVKPHTLHPDTLALMSSVGWTLRGAWVTATAYAVRDMVTEGGASYVCVTAHTSGTFATDLAALKWQTLTANGTTPYLTFFNSTPTVTPTAAATDGVALGSNAVSGAARAIAIGKGNASGADSVAINITDATGTYGATGANSVAIGFQAKASAQYAIAIGALASANALQATSIGGLSNAATAASAACVGGSTNANGGANSAVVGGNLHSITGAGSYSGIVGGRSGIISAQNGFIGGGENNTVDANSGVALGGEYNKVHRKGQVSWGNGAASGQGQTSSVVPVIETTNATPTVMLLKGADNIAIANNSTVQFRIMVCGRRTDVAGDAGAYEFVGLVANNAGTTALVGSVTKTVIAESNAAWDAAVTANNATDAIDITVTGVAAQTIQWAARIDMVEIGVV